jgi:hypothetical protein
MKTFPGISERAPPETLPMGALSGVFRKSALVRSMETKLTLFIFLPQFPKERQNGPK